MSSNGVWTSNQLWLLFHPPAIPTACLVPTGTGNMQARGYWRMRFGLQKLTRYKAITVSLLIFSLVLSVTESEGLKSPSNCLFLLLVETFLLYMF